MGKKYGLVLIFLVFILFGIGIGVFNYFYSLPFISNYLFRKEFSINPATPIDPNCNYEITLWYYPVFRTIKKDKEFQKEFWLEVSSRIQEAYPNISLQLHELSFLEGREKLAVALEKGTPPDLYLNLCNDSWLNEQWQVPVERYIDSEEKSSFYTVDWEGKGKKSHLWAWPFLLYRQSWYSNGGQTVSMDSKTKFLNYIHNRGQQSLLFNYHDQTLLRQMLTLHGLSELRLIDGKLDDQTEHGIGLTYNYLNQLRQQEILRKEDTEEMLKLYFRGDNLIIAPVNPWLNNYLMQKGKSEYRFTLPGLYELYTLSVFRQKKYKGDDHTRAVMETAKLIVKEYAAKIAEVLKLEPAYIEMVESEASKKPVFWKKMEQILQVYPEQSDHWQTILANWYQFWEKGIIPDNYKSEE